jgi:Myb-like DNA-binding domain
MTEAELHTAITSGSKGARNDQLLDGWRFVGKALPGRALVTIRRHVREKLRAKDTGETGAWTDDEIKKLEAGIQKHGVGRWTAIAKEVGTRTAMLCKARWRLNPNGKAPQEETGKTVRRAWSSDEDEHLKQAVLAYCVKNDIDPEQDNTAIGWKVVAAELNKDFAWNTTSHKCLKRWELIRPRFNIPKTRSWDGPKDNKTLLQR